MLDHSDWRKRAAAQGFITQALIDGQWRPAQSGATFASINPASNQLLAEVAACDAADVDAAVGVGVERQHDGELRVRAAVLAVRSAGTARAAPLAPGRVHPPS